MQLQTRFLVILLMCMVLYGVVEEVAKRGACQRFWQTYAWSKGQLSKSANLHQYKNGQFLAGHDVDLNDRLGNEGWWDTNPQ